MQADPLRVAKAIEAYHPVDLQPSKSRQHPHFQIGEELAVGGEIRESVGGTRPARAVQSATIVEIRFGFRADCR